MPVAARTCPRPSAAAAVTVRDALTMRLPRGSLAHHMARSVPLLTEYVRQQTPAPSAEARADGESEEEEVEAAREGQTGDATARWTGPRAESKQSSWDRDAM